MKKNNNKMLELNDLQKMLLSICSNINRPIRKSQLIKMVTELFNCNTLKQVDFALLDLIEKGEVIQKDYFIVTPEFYEKWDGHVSAADEGIIKFLLSLKEEIKHDIFFNVFAPERISTNIFFKYIKATYPALVDRNTTALSYMKQIEDIIPYGLSNEFYVEMNDYSIYRWFTKFFDNADCRIFIQRTESHRKYISFQLILLPGRRRSYADSHIQYEEFKEHIGAYFDSNINIHCKSTLLTMRTRNNHTKKKT